MGRKKFRNRKLKIVTKIPAKAAPVSSSSAPPPKPPSSAVPPPPPPPPWIELPGDVTANILQRLGAEEIMMSAQSVCTTWWKACLDPAMWRVIHLINPEQLNEEYTIMCRHAVDRSQGQLVDLTIGYFGDDELLNYVVDRSSNLKRLTLESSDDISGESLTEAVKKLPQLEELHLIMEPGVEAVDIETIGISCPTLKSFSYNDRGSKIRIPIDDDILEGYDLNEYALAIGKGMPNLHHLQLFASCMQNEGLEAILDSCPRLESLDIRQCYQLDLGGDLGKRCRGQIKDLKLPSDSISDVSRLAGEPSEWDHYKSFDFGCDFSDYDYYGEYETYDDYFSPSGFGFFDNDLQQFFHPFDPEFR